MAEPNCPKCGKELERKQKMYCFNGEYFSGLVCCGSLWSDGDEEGFGEFYKAAKNF